MADLPDVTNPQIRAMVLRDHEPEETWLLGKNGPYALVYCATCWQSWPCPSHLAAWKAEKEATQAAIRRADEWFKREPRPKRRWWWFGG